MVQPDSDYFTVVGSRIHSVSRVEVGGVRSSPFAFRLYGGLALAFLPFALGPSVLGQSSARPLYSKRLDLTLIVPLSATRYALSGLICCFLHQFLNLQCEPLYFK